MMTKKSRIQLYITALLLPVIILSMFSSFLLFKEVSNMQVDKSDVEKILFMRQYEYELLRTNNAFSEAFPIPLSENSEAQFTKWFNILWSRVQDINRGKVGASIANEGFDYQTAQETISTIDEAIYNSNTLLADDILHIRNLFNAMSNSVHAFQAKRASQLKKKRFEEQNTVYNYYRNSFFLSSLALILGLIVFIFLSRSNKKLLNMQHKLEERVSKRTQALHDKNQQLNREVQERCIIEQQLVNSQKETERAKEQALHQLNYDPLTKLASRILFTQRLQQSVQSAQENASKTALLFVDLDRFKDINDSLGHSFGDQLLQQAAQRIQLCLNTNDTAARFGGDEFAIVLPQISGLTQVEQIAQRIIQELSLAFDLSGNRSYITGSIGIAICPDDGTDNETLTRKADIAMYKAKDQGKNTYQFFTEQMEIESNRRRSMETALRAAVKNQSFSLVYQPIIDSQSGNIVAAEALIRWSDERGEEIPPSLFIPLAEEFGLIIELGEWVLRTACEQARKWQLAGWEGLTICVNLSYKQFQRNDMFTTIYNILADTQLPAHKLSIEITEGLLMIDDTKIKQQLELLRNLGVALSIDDFGTGYASLSYLNKFPINVIKIDHSFIQNLATSDENEDLVKGIISLAKSLDMKVIAEGVENKAQADQLMKNNCQYFQGFLYSKPLKETLFEQFLISNQMREKPCESA